MTSEPLVLFVGSMFNVASQLSLTHMTSSKY